MFSPLLVCAINVCLVQQQDMYDMLENVRQSNLQSVFLQAIYLKKKQVNFTQECVL